MTLRGHHSRLALAAGAALVVACSLGAARSATAYYPIDINCQSTVDSLNKVHWKWTITFHLFDSGTAGLVLLQSGVELAPDNSGTLATARLLNTDGTPVVDHNGQAMEMTASPPDGAAALAKYGLISGAHRWDGMRASAPLPPLPPGGLDMKLEFAIEGEVAPEGAIWISDNGLESYGAETQPDLYLTFGGATPVNATTWGGIKSLYPR